MNEKRDAIRQHHLDLMATRLGGLDVDDVKHEACEQHIGHGVALGAALGMAVGAGIGAALGNLALGIGFGLCIGAGLGIALGASRDN